MYEGLIEEVHLDAKILHLVCLDLNYETNQLI
jgi:hypothetical protein